MVGTVQCVCAALCKHCTREYRYWYCANWHTLQDIPYGYNCNIYWIRGTCIHTNRFAMCYCMFALLILYKDNSPHCGFLIAHFLIR